MSNAAVRNAVFERGVNMIYFVLFINLYVYTASLQCKQSNHFHPCELPWAITVTTDEDSIH